MDHFQQRLGALFENNPALETLRQLLVGKQSSWLVGGCLRDLLLGREVVDVDIATAGDPTVVAQEWAARCHGRWFWLDPERKQSRVLLANQLVVDFVPLRADSITADLKLRDYTINALALPLQGELTRQALLDPLQGQRHLAANLLILCSEKSLVDDPLRMLKGIRHAACLGMALAEETLQQIRSVATSIKQVAGERLRDELGKILLSKHPVDAFELMLETNLLPAIIGPAGPNWQATKAFSDLKTFDQRMLRQQAEADETAVSEPYSSRALFLLATLFRCYQPTNLPDLLHRQLRLSRQQQRIITSLQEPLPKNWLAQRAQVTSPRQQALLVESLGYFPAEQMIYWSLYQQQLPLEMVYELLNAYQSHQQRGRVPDLLDGHQLQQILQCSGRQIGSWQAQIKQAELAGEISDSQTAKDWLKSKISD